MFLIPSCKSSEIWDIPEEQFTTLLQKGDPSFLSSLSIDERRLDEIGILGPGSAYYLSFYFDSLERHDLENSLLELEFRKDRMPWKYYAALSYLDSLLERKEFEEAEGFARRMMAELKVDPPILSRFTRALYRQHKDDEVIDAVAAAEGLVQAGATGSYDFEAEPFSSDPELALMLAVSSYRLKKENWKELFLSLYADFSAKEIHQRAFVYARNQEAMQETFNSDLYTFFAWKSALFRGEYRQALTMMEQLLGREGVSGVPDRVMYSGKTISDMGVMYLRSGYFSRGAEIMDKLSRISSLEKDTARVVFHTAGVLRRAAGRNREAAEYFRKALRLSGLPETYDRELWYLLSSLYRVSVPDAVKGVESFSTAWHDPGYFSDILDDILSALVRSRNWRMVKRLRNALEGAAEPGFLFRMDYLLAVAGQRPFPQAPLAAPTGAYESLLVSIMAGDDLPEFLKTRGYLSVPEETLSSMESYILGFTRFGLYEEAYTRGMSSMDSLSFAAAENLSAALLENGFPREGINIISRYLRRSGTLPTERNRFFLHPVLYEEIAEKAAEREDIPLYFLYALIREESYFDPDIVSHAGATGLTQLMPGTARDMAKKMKIHPMDLEDPEVNITLGSRYLGEMLKRYGSPLAALGAYNAGPGRMKRWNAEFGDLEPLLFIEAIPFRETRNYCKKVLVSSVVYGYLYQDLSVREVLDWFFPANTKD